MRLFLFIFCLFFLVAQQAPVDPSFIQGRLENGLRYFIKKNSLPPGKMELWLKIGSGSLDEEDHQRGLAHYLEHLAFNGSENFPKGSLIKYFESLGLKFGGHLNAFTSFEQTTYTLSLPKSDTKILDKAMLCLSDYAYRLNLDEVEIEKEREIILEEKRVGSTAYKRFWKEYMKVMFPNSHLSRRLPIGTEEGIKSFKRKDFVNFYTKWYYPRNATLIAVGDFSVEDVKKAIARNFSSWKKAPFKEHLKSGVVVNSKSRISIISDEEFEDTNVFIENIFLKKPNHNIEYYEEKFIQNVINYSVNLRFRRALQKREIDFKAYLYNYNFVQDVNIFSVNAEGEFDDWQKMIHTLVYEISQIKKYGFFIEELILSQKHFLSQAKRALKTQSTRKSPHIIRNLSRLLSKNLLPQSAMQKLRMAQDFFKNISLTKINNYFKQHYNLQSATTIIKIPQKNRNDISIAKVQSILEKAKKQELLPRKFDATTKELFSQKLQGGVIIQIEKAQHIPITSFTLENNIIVNHYYSDLKKSNIELNFTFPTGKLSEKQDEKGLHKASLLAFNTPATNKLTSSDIEYLLTGKDINISTFNQRDSVLVTLQTTKKDLEEGLQLIYLLLTEPKIQSSEFKIWHEKQQQEINKLDYQIEQKHWSRFADIISYGDWRFTLITQKELDNIDITKAQKKLESWIKAPLEIAVVGDIKLEKIKQLGKKYFGSLPKRQEISYQPKLRKLKRLKNEKNVVQDIENKTNKSLILFAWRYQNYSDVQKRLALELASHIIDTKLTKQIREDMSLTYSINTSFLAHESLPERGMFYGTFSSEPNKSQSTLDLVKKIVTSFAQKEQATYEQLKVARKQALHILERKQKRLFYWSSHLSGMKYRKRDIDFPAKKAKLLKAITLEQVRKALKEIIKEENFFSLITKTKNKNEKKE